MSSMSRVVCGLCFAVAFTAADVQPARNSDAPPLVIEKQGSFFVGGRDLHSETLVPGPGGSPPSPAGTITVDQVYVRYQIPARAKRYAITLIHGCCLTGKTWETTPDGRMGWDEYFVRKGYPTYVIDQAWRGRSAANATVIDDVKAGKAPPDQLPSVLEARHESAWVTFRFGPEYPKVFAGMQFPLESQAEFWKQMVPDWNAALAAPNPTVKALSELAQRIGGTVLISHSQSGIYPFQVAVLSTKGIAGIVSIEPGACPAPSEDLTPYLAIPVLVMFGDYVDQSPFWSPRIKQCKEFVEAATRAGGKATVVELPDVGIKGNSHMLMQDKNNLEVADWLLAWIGKVR